MFLFQPLCEDDHRRVRLDMGEEHRVYPVTVVVEQCVQKILTSFLELKVSPI